MLDDKSYVNRFKDQIIAQAYAEDDDPENDQSTIVSPLESQLMQAYIKSPSVFERSNKVRQSAERKGLCEKLKMTHEQVEGWAIMFSRNVNILFLILFNNLFVAQEGYYNA